MASNRNSINNFLTSRDGVAATEFALILGVLVLILAIIITVGWIFYVRNNMESAARAGARSMAALETSGSGTPVPCSNPTPAVGSTEEITCDSLVQIAPPDITVEAVDCCSQRPNDLCPPEPLDEFGDPDPLDDRAVVVRISVDAPDAAILDIFEFFEGVVMSSTAEMRREDECPPPPPP